MKSTFILSAGTLIVAAILVSSSCNKKDTVERLNGIYIVPAAANSAIENKTLLYATTPYKFSLAAAISMPVATNVDVTITVDNSMVAAYNTAQKTTYATMPEGSYSLEATNLTIQQDSLASNQTNLVIKSNMLTADVSYLLPVRVATVSSSAIMLNSAIATKYYIVRAPTPEIVNLTTGKSSYWKNPSASYNAARGNDGNTNGDWGGGSVCESGPAAEQYWEVNLGAVSPRVDTVRIWNRTDCCDDRTTDFYVFISEVPFTTTTVAGSLAQPGVKSFFTAGKAGRPTTILPTVSGRYIRLQNTGSTSLTLAELSAIGVKP